MDGAKNSADVLAWSFTVKERVDEVFGEWGGVSYIHKFACGPDASPACQLASLPARTTA